MLQNFVLIFRVKICFWSSTPMKNILMVSTFPGLMIWNETMHAKKTWSMNILLRSWLLLFIYLFIFLWFTQTIKNIFLQQEFRYMHLTTVCYSKECSFVSMVMWSWGEAIEYVLVMTLYIPSSSLSDDAGYTQWYSGQGDLDAGLSVDGAGFTQPGTTHLQELLQWWGLAGCGLNCWSAELVKIGGYWMIDFCITTKNKWSQKINWRLWDCFCD